MSGNLRLALERVCDVLEKFDPDAPDLHFARGLLSGGSKTRLKASAAAMREMRESGATLDQIAMKFNCSTPTVYKYTRGIAALKKLADPDMVQDYTDGLSITDVAIKHRKESWVVRKLLVAAGVTIRPKSCVKKPAIDHRIPRIMELRDEGKSLEEIGGDLGITRERVRQLVVKAGMKLQFAPRPLTFEQREALDAYADGMSLKLAAAKFGVGECSFKKHLTDNGIAIRPRFRADRIAAMQKAKQVARLYQEGVHPREIVRQAGLSGPENIYYHLARANVTPNRASRKAI